MKTAIFFVLFSQALWAAGQFSTQFSTDTLKINSAFLVEERVAWIQKPNGYDTTTTSYPLLVLLDADGHFNHVSSTMPYLHNRYNKEIPAMLVVGIPSARRNAILTPKTGNIQYDTISNRGEADLFLSFIEKELLPVIEKQYRVNNFRVLLGHSLGGLFSIYSLYAKPGLFRAVIAASPSAGYAGGVTYKKFIPDLLKQPTDSSRYFYFSVSGNDIAGYDKENEKLKDVLEKNPTQGFNWNYKTFKHLNHWTIAPPAFFTGLVMLFARKELAYLKN